MYMSIADVTHRNILSKIHQQQLRCNTIIKYIGMQIVCRKYKCNKRLTTFGLIQ